MSVTVGWGVGDWLTKHDSTWAMVGIEESDTNGVARLKLNLGGCLERKGFQPPLLVSVGDVLLLEKTLVEVDTRRASLQLQKHGSRGRRAVDPALSVSRQHPGVASDCTRTVGLYTCRVLPNDHYGCDSRSMPAEDCLQFLEKSRLSDSKMVVSKTRKSSREEGLVGTRGGGAEGGAQAHLESQETP